MPSTAFLAATRASVRSWTPWPRSVVINTAKMSSANSNHDKGEVDTNMHNMCHQLANELVKKTIKEIARAREAELWERVEMQRTIGQLASL